MNEANSRREPHTNVQTHVALRILLVGVADHFARTLTAMAPSSALVRDVVPVTDPKHAADRLLRNEANCVFLNPIAFNWRSTKELLQLCTLTFPVCLVSTTAQMETLDGVSREWKAKLPNYYRLPVDTANSELSTELEYAIRGCHRFLWKQFVRANVPHATLVATSESLAQLTDIEELEHLLQAGTAFTFENFAVHSAHGSVIAPTKDWFTWIGLVKEIAWRVGGPGSDAAGAAHQGSAIEIAGADNFERAKALMLGALQITLVMARRSASAKVLAPGVPAPISHIAQPHEVSVPATVTAPAIASPTSRASSKGTTMPDPKKVFIIHGRNVKARDELGIFLRSLGLSPVNFMDLRASMGGTPTVAEIVERGMDQAQGVIALITADEYAAVRLDFRYTHDQPDDIARWQARPNVIFEAGMAFGRDRKRVVFVLLGPPKLFTDVAGIHVLRPNNDPSGDRATLRDTLSRGMGCEIEPHSTDWMKFGDFETCVNSLQGVSPRDPF